MVQQAVKTIEGGNATVVNDAPVPALRDGYILVETKALSLNPTDWKHMRRLAEPGTTLGCDWAGIVLDVGKGVTKFKPGDQVFGVVHGGFSFQPQSGAFAQKIIAADFTTWHKPSHLSFEEASTLGVALITICQTMYLMAGLPPPLPENLSKPASKDVLIYGGSSATGTVAIQFAKLSGYRVHTTASPRNFAMLKSRGADHIYDYNDPSAPADIKAASNDGITYIIDCIGSESTIEFCAKVLSSKGGHYHSVSFPLKPKFKELRPEESARGTSALAYTLWGEAFEFRNGNRFDARPDEKKFAQDWLGIPGDLLNQGAIVPHPPDVRSGGLQGVIEGLKEMEEKGTSGKKMVYTMV